MGAGERFLTPDFDIALAELRENADALMGDIAMRACQLGQKNPDAKQELDELALFAMRHVASGFEGNMAIARKLVELQTKAVVDMVEANPFRR